MRKITLLLLSVFFYLEAHAQLPETFDTALPGTWATFIGTNGEGTTEDWAHQTAGYMRVLWEDVPTLAEDWLVSPQVAITTTTSLLVFDQTDSATTDYGSTLTVRISTGSSQTTHADFVIVDTQNETDVTNGTALQFSRHEVDLSAYEGQTVYIAFVWAQDDGDALFLDNIDLENQNATAPEPVITPTPSDTATEVIIDAADDNMDGAPDNSVTFAWEAAATGDAPTSYDVYLGDSPTTLNLLGNTGNTTVDITGMEYSTLYYWQIVAKNAGGDAVNSSIWSFTTQAELSVGEVNSNDFKFYPNPTTGLIQFESTLPITKLEVINLFGQQVLRTDNEILATNQLDISSLKAGTYIMVVTIGDNVSSYKVVKQ
ncbi:choice-of-anchor J domain-containing protein [Kordia sp.]|uniref:choice-of-anchor J domain-containing protein n=1 Tax=Kordia sp. TaxID=1965332 RepID=UPI003B5A41A8